VLCPERSGSAVQGYVVTFRRTSCKESWVTDTVQCERSKLCLLLFVSEMSYLVFYLFLWAKKWYMHIWGGGKLPSYLKKNNNKGREDIGTGMGCPGRWWSRWPWRCSRNAWTCWGTWFSENYWWWVNGWTGWSWGSFPTLVTLLWFYDTHAGWTLLSSHMQLPFHRWIQRPARALGNPTPRSLLSYSRYKGFFSLFLSFFLSFFFSPKSF